jgi:hypothetical protein
VALDYKRIEYVEFQDEDNYYFVKIVNKLKADEPAAKTVKTRAKREPVRVYRPEPDAGRGTRREPVRRPAPGRGKPAPARKPPPEPDWDEDYLRP